MNTFYIHIETTGLSAADDSILYIGLYTLDGEVVKEVHIKRDDIAEDCTCFKYSDFTYYDMMEEGVDIYSEEVGEVMDIILANNIIGFNMVWINNFLRAIEPTYIAKNSYSLMEYFKWAKIRGLVDSVALNRLVPDNVLRGKVNKGLYLVKRILNEPIH